MSESSDSEADVWVYAFSKYTYSCTETWDFNTSNPLVRDLAGLEVLTFDGSADQWLTLLDSGAILNPHNERYDGESDTLVWIGATAPEWWTEWALIVDWLGPDVVDGLIRQCFESFTDEGLRWQQNFSLPPAFQTLLTAKEGQVRMYEQAEADLRTVFALDSGTESLANVASRWMEDSAPGSTLDTLRPIIVASLARHPNTPPGVLKELAVSDRESVRCLVTRNPGASDETRAMAVLKGVDPIDEEDFKQLSTRDNIDFCYEGVDLYWACHPLNLYESDRRRYHSALADPRAPWITDNGQVQFDSRIHVCDDLNDIGADAVSNYGPLGYITDFYED